MKTTIGTGTAEEMARTRLLVWLAAKQADMQEAESEASADGETRQALWYQAKADAFAEALAHVQMN